VFRKEYDMSSPLLGKILEEYKEGNNRIGLLEFNGKRRTIYLNLVPEAHAGDYVRFHAGFATERVDPNGREVPDAGQQPAGGTKEKDHGWEQKSPQNYRLLSELDPQQLRKLLPLAHEKHFEVGTVIFRAGERSLFLHLIVSGEVALEEDSGDQPVHVQTLHAGDAMGWSALTSGALTHFRASAVSHVSTVAFAGDQIQAACDRDPAMGYALMKQLLELVTERLDALRVKLAGRSHAIEVP
jgi:hydrogenase maturation factor